MDSNIFNLAGARAEKLDSLCTFMNIQDDGSGGLLYGGGSTTIDLESDRFYVIDRIRLVITNFANPDKQTVAFPLFEQFALGWEIKGFTANSGIPQTKLWDNMQYNSSDGVENQPVYQEQFIFVSNANPGSQLYLVFTPNSSIFVNLTGIALPPVLGQSVNVNGAIYLEGYSYPSATGTRLKDQSDFTSGNTVNNVLVKILTGINNLVDKISNFKLF